MVGAPVGHHRFQQVGGHVDGAAPAVGPAHDRLLVEGHVLERDLPGQVAAVHQHRVGAVDDPVHVANARAALDLGDQVRAGRERPHELDVSGRAGERQGHVANAEGHAHRDRGAILVGEGRQLRCGIHDDALARPHFAPVDHHRLGVILATLADAELRAVEVDHDQAARPQRREHRPGPQADLVSVPLDRLGGETDPVALAQGHTGRHRAATHLGAFEVQAERLGGGRLHQLDARFEPLEGGVGQIDAEQVHARLVELLDDLGGQRRRPQRAQNLDFHGPPRRLWSLGRLRWFIFMPPLPDT
jgi:hypothetical protein